MENSNLEQFFHLFSTILRLKEKRETKASSLVWWGGGGEENRDGWDVQIFPKVKSKSKSNDWKIIVHLYNLVANGPVTRFRICLKSILLLILYTSIRPLENWFVFNLAKRTWSRGKLTHFPAGATQKKKLFKMSKIHTHIKYETKAHHAIEI